MKRLLKASTALSLALMLASCSTDSTSNQATGEENSQSITSETAVETTETETSGMVVDEENQTIELTVEINEDMREEGTQHAVVQDSGGNADVSLLHGTTNPADLHAALLQIGAEPGDNLTMDDLSEAKTIEGSPLDLTVSWEGQEPIPFTDILNSENEGIANADFRFGGNLEANTEMETGCTICLYSCPIGIVSNAGVPANEMEDLNVQLNNDMLPEAGTPLTVQLSLAQ